MDKTNYSLLSIVAVVAIVAIVAMYMHSERTGGSSIANSAPFIEVTNTASQGSGSALTGMVSIDREERQAAPVQERARPSIDESLYDLDGSGVIDSNDVEVLKQVVARQIFCPQGKRCDVNEDGVVDQSDLNALRKVVLSYEGARLNSQKELNPTYIAPVPTSKKATVGIAAAGVPLN